MLGGKSCDIFIELDPIPQPFYKAGDSVSGHVNLNIFASSVSIKDIQIKLRCDEYSAVASDDDRKQATMEKREAKHVKRAARRERKGQDSGVAKPTFTAPTPSAVTDHQRHIELTTNVLVGDGAAGGKQSLPKGAHRYEFSIALPETVNMLPPHAPVPTRNGLRIGVEWTVKAVAHRTGHLKSSVRAVAEIPVHPTPDNAELGDLSRCAELSGQKFLGKKKKSYLGSLFGVTHEQSAEQQIVVRLGYPEVGIPQGPIKPNFSLTLEAPHGPVTVTGLSIYLVQRCLATLQKKRTLNDTYKNLFLMGQAKAIRVVRTDPQDLSDLVSAFELRDVFPPPFTSNYITISYSLRIEVECASRKENKPDIVVLEVPVNVIGPGLCWPSKSAGSFDARARAPQPIADDNFDSDSSSATVAVDNESCLPTYEEALPSANSRVIDENTYNELKH